MSDLYIDATAVCRFASRAGDYDRYAVVQREIASRLVDRLQYMNVQPNKIIDLGCGTGYVAELLSQKYQHAEITGVDSSADRISQLTKKALSNVKAVQADVASLPFADASVDMIISSGLLHWLNDIESCLAECRRVLKPNGLLLFATLGPTTLQELKNSFLSVDRKAVHDFCDMHDVGDVLLSLQFSDPVMDSEVVTFLYENVAELFQDLTKTGSQNTQVARAKGLLTRNRLRAMKQYYRQHYLDEDQCVATFEVVYGHAWGPVKAKQQVSGDGTEVYVDVSAVAKKR